MDAEVCDLIARRLQDLGQQRHRVGGGVDDGQEELVLVAEVVVDQCGVDAGRRRDGADARAVEPLLGEDGPRGGQDRLPGVGVARAAAGRSSGAQVVLLRRVAAARARATRAAPATIATSNHMVPVASAEEPTSCSASTA